MANIPATEFKAKCLELMDRVAERQETYVITKRGKAVARLVPLERKANDSIFGWLSAQGTIAGDILSPAIPTEKWESLREWEDLRAIDERRRRSRSSGSPNSPRSRR